MEKVKVVIEVLLNTNKDSYAIEKAIRKGVYVGLDLQNVAMPKDVESVTIDVQHNQTTNANESKSV